MVAGSDNRLQQGVRDSRHTGFSARYPVNLWARGGARRRLLHAHPDRRAAQPPQRRPALRWLGVFCAGAATGDITPPITSPQWAYTARNCPEATAVDVAGNTADPQNHVEEGQAYLLKGGPHCVAGKIAPDTDLYSKSWPGTEGTFGRLQANTYVLDDGRGNRVAIIQADLGGIPGELHTYVANHIPGLGIDQAHLLISATHDHGSVGGMWLGAGYAALGGDEYDPASSPPSGWGWSTPSRRRRPG